MDDQSPPTQLLAALWNNDWATALSLVAAGADPNTIDFRDVGQEWTPLHFAADVGDSELIRALVAAGAEVNALSVAGQSPLWWACNNDHLAAAHELLLAGADPNARSADGYSPLGRVSRSNAELVELIRKKGGVL